MRLFKSDWVDRVPDHGSTSPTTCRSRPRWSPARSASAQGQVEAQNFEIRKNVLKYDDVHEPPARGHLRRAPPGARGRGPARADPPLHRRRRRGLRRRRDRRRASPRTGTSSSCGPRCSTLYPVSHHRRRGRRGRPAAAARLDRRDPRSRSCTADAHARVRRSARRSSAPRSCASSSAASCSRCSTASGASTSTRWTTCRRASACARWPSATRWSSTSARASTCSPR